MVALLFYRLKKSVAFLFLLFSLVIANYGQTETTELKLSETVTRQIRKTDKHSFKIKLEKNQTAEIDFDWKVVYLSVTVTNPDKSVSPEIEMPYAIACRHRFLLVAETAGDYQLDVFTTSRTARPGDYSIKLAGVRAFVERDAKLLQNQMKITELRSAAFAEEGKATAESRQKAIGLYQKIVPLAREFDNRCAEASAVNAIGRIQSALANVPETIKNYEEAVKLWREAGSKLSEGIVSSSLGFTYYKLADYDQALFHIGRANAIAAEIGNKQLEAITFNNLALVYEALYEIEKARDHYEKALVFFTETRDTVNIATVQLNLATIYFTFSENLRAIELCEQSIKGYEAIKEKDLTVNLDLLGMIYLELGNPRKALEYFQKTRDLSKELGNSESETAAIRQLGNSYLKLGDFDKAQEYLNEALEMSKKLKLPVREADALFSLGRFYQELGEYERALGFMNGSLEILQKTQEKRSEIVNLLDIGAVLEAQGKGEKALPYYEQALARAMEIKDPVRAGEVYQSLGNVELQNSRYEKAETYFNEALKITRNALLKPGEAASLANLAMTYLKKGDRQKALSYADESVNLWRSIGIASSEADALYKRVLIRRDLGDLKGSISDVEAAVGLVEARRRTIRDSSLRSSYFSTVQDYYELYLELLRQFNETEPNQGFDQRAFETSERLRARSLLEMIREGRIELQKGVNPQLVEKESELITKLSDTANERQRVVRSEPDREKSLKLERQFETEINSILQGLENVRTQIRRENPQYAALTQAPTTSVKDIQGLLDNETVLLEYKLGGPKSFLWFVTVTKFRQINLPSRDEIEPVAKAFYEAITSRDKNQTTKLAEYSQKLNDLLIAPVAMELRGKRILIVADGVLQYLPFAALTGNEIINLPSAAILAELRQRPAGKIEQNAIVFADPIFDINDARLASVANKTQPTEKSMGFKQAIRDFTDEAGLPRLLSSRFEAKSISALIPPQNVDVRIDFDASRENVVKNGLKNYQIIHFATHGLLNTAHPELSGLVFSLFDKDGNSQDGFLRLNQIYNLDLNSELVVLSACQTALGKDVRGEGLIGLTRGFMYAGAKRIVASLWKVDDAATAEFMKRFYQNLLVKKMKPAAALRRTQDELKQIPRYKSPYFWAGFTIQGDWR